MTMLQKRLFGEKAVVVENELIKNKAKPVVKHKSPLAKLNLDDGLDLTTVKMEAVFWHRLIINQHSKSLMNPKLRKKFVRCVLSEFKLKRGMRSPELLMLDMLLMKNLG